MPQNKQPFISDTGHADISDQLRAAMDANSGNERDSPVEPSSPAGHLDHAPSNVASETMTRNLHGRGEQSDVFQGLNAAGLSQGNMALPQLPMGNGYRIPKRKRAKKSRTISSSSSNSDDSSISSSSSGSHSRRNKSKKAKKVRKGGDLPKFKDIVFRQQTHSHQYQLNENVYRKIRKARTSAKGRSSKAVRSLNSALNLIRERQETLLIADQHGWQVVSTMDANANLKGLSKDRTKDLKAALQVCGSKVGKVMQTSSMSRPRGPQLPFGRPNSNLSNREIMHNSFLKKGRCYNCRAVGHFGRDCPNTVSQPGSSSTSTLTTSQPALQGAIEESGVQPHCVNPLSVAVQASGKKRLILDCSFLNTYVARFKFRYEDLSTVLPLLNAKKFLSKFDLKSGYFHIKIDPKYSTYLGFAWEIDGRNKFFKYVVLPFGVSSAPYIFTKVLRPLVKKWRGEGVRIVLYLDDGLLIAESSDDLLWAQEVVIKDLWNAGFIINIAKSEFTPSYKLEFLGFNIDTENLQLSIPQKKIYKILNSVRSISIRLTKGRATKRNVLSTAGLLISCKHVLMNTALLYTKGLFKCASNAINLESYIHTGIADALEELLFWSTHLANMATRPIKKQQALADLEIYCDASATGAAAILINVPANFCFCPFSASQQTESSCFREIFAVAYGLHAFTPKLTNKVVDCFTDSKSAVSVIRNGSMIHKLQELALIIDRQCQNLNLILNVFWLPRNRNTIADELSRYSDWDDWGISFELVKHLEKKWVTCTIDLFANHFNKKKERFFSKNWCPGTSGINAFSKNWEFETAWACPPPKLVTATLEDFKNYGSLMILLVPLWHSADYWPSFTQFSLYSRFIQDIMVISDAGRFIEASTQRASWLEAENYRLNLLALYLKH